MNILMSPQGLQAVLYQMLMFHGNRQVLFNELTPNSKLLISWPGNGKFWRARRASGMRRIKKLNKTKRSWIPILGGGPFYENNPILTFDITPS